MGITSRSDQRCHLFLSPGAPPAGLHLDRRHRLLPPPPASQSFAGLGSDRRHRLQLLQRPSPPRSAGPRSNRRCLLLLQRSPPSVPMRLGLNQLRDRLDRDGTMRSSTPARLRSSGSARFGLVRCGSAPTLRLCDFTQLPPNRPALRSARMVPPTPHAVPPPRVNRSHPQQRAVRTISTAESTSRPLKPETIDGEWPCWIHRPCAKGACAKSGATAMCRPSSLPFTLMGPPDAQPAPPSLPSPPRPPCALIYLVFRQFNTMSAQHHRLLYGIEAKTSLCSHVVHCLHPDFFTTTRVCSYHKLVRTHPICMGPG
jgi:hypothetical protein